jgi:Ca2+-binding RTX toxin-like protein
MTMNAHVRFIAGLAACFLATALVPAAAAVIDFEVVPGDTPADQLAITNQYAVSEGVTFSLSNGGTPFLEAAGDADRNAGFYRNWPEETAAADVERESYTGLGLGGFFLRLGTGGLATAPVPVLIIDFSTPATAASGQIWDIDSNQFGIEQWRVQAFDASAQVIASVDSPAGLDSLTEQSLDGLPWNWAIDLNGNANIHQIRVSFIGTKVNDIGLSFDNFTFQFPCIVGTAGDDTLEGTPHADCINGKAGADSMAGLGGNDTYTVDNTGDTVIEGAGEGTDTIKSSVSYTLPIYVENLTLTGTNAINGTGNGLANVLTGNAANNVLNGKAGADTMAGKAGNDTYYVDNTGDKVTEGVDQGTDTVRSTITRTLPNNVENLLLTGATAINGTGNTLANKLTGNGAANTLNGKAGNDTLVGGAGPDRLLFNTAPNTSTNYDKITDFDPAVDTIRLENAVYTGLTATGTLAAAAFKVGTTASTAAHRILYDPATGNLRYDADGAGGAAAVRFAQLTTKPALTNADFYVQ